MIYVLTKEMYNELGGQHQRVIDYINRFFNLRGTVVGLHIKEQVWQRRNNGTR
jgi:hypothetical protein